MKNEKPFLFVIKDGRLKKDNIKLTLGKGDRISFEKGVDLEFEKHGISFYAEEGEFISKPVSLLHDKVSQEYTPRISKDTEEMVAKSKVIELLNEELERAKELVRSRDRATDLYILGHDDGWVDALNKLEQEVEEL